MFVAALIPLICTLAFLALRSRNGAKSGSPTVVPSYIPWLGCALEYGRSPAAFLKACRKRYGSVFKFLIAGRSMVIVSSHETVASLFKDKHEALEDAGGPILRNAIGSIKSCPEIVHIIESELIPMATHNLLPSSLTITTLKFNQALLAHLNQLLPSSSDDIVVPLLSITSKSLYDANSLAILGPLLPTDSYDDFVTFDAGLPYLMSNIPFVGREAKLARDRLLKLIETYLTKGWRENGQGYIEGASDFLSGATRVIKQANVIDSEAAILLLGLMVGIHSNVIRTSFWMVAYLLANPATFARVREEVRSTIASEFSDLTTLATNDMVTLNKAKFPLVDAVIKETLRLTAVPSSLRAAKFDTQIYGENGKVYHIEKGDCILVDARGVHFDEKVFPDPETFNIDRFLSNRPRTILAFGGGPQMCKGRHASRHFLKVFLIMLLDMYDLSVVGQAIIPKANSLSTGTLEPLEDIMVRLRRKRKEGATI